MIYKDEYIVCVSVTSQSDHFYSMFYMSDNPCSKQYLHSTLEVAEGCQVTELKLVLPTSDDVPTDTLRPHQIFTCWIQDRSQSHAH